MATQPQFDLAILNRILDQECPEMRFQDPKIEKHGLHWRIRPFVPVVTKEGKVERKRKPIILGYCHEMTASEAKKKKQEVMATINGGKLVVQAQAKFGELLDKYEQARLPLLGFATQNKYQSHIDVHIRPAFAEMKLMEMDKATVQAWITRKIQDGLSHATLTDLKNVMSAIFTKAKDWRMWDGEKPTTGLDLGKKRDIREGRILTGKELLSFMVAIPDTAVIPAGHARLMVMAAVQAGLRVSEVLGLRPEDVDVEQGTLTVRRRWHRGNLDVPKSERGKRTVYVGREFAAELKALSYDGFLFANGAEFPPDDRDIQQHVFRPAAEAAGCHFQGFGMHTFRRMYITYRGRAGASVFELMKAAGHGDLRTTARYTILSPEREAELAEAAMKLIKRDTGRVM